MAKLSQFDRPQTAGKLGMTLVEFYKLYVNASADPKVWRKHAKDNREAPHLKELMHMPEVQALAAAKIKSAEYFEDLASKLEACNFYFESDGGPTWVNGHARQQPRTFYIVFEHPELSDNLRLDFETAPAAKKVLRQLKSGEINIEQAAQLANNKWR